MAGLWCDSFDGETTISKWLRKWPGASSTTGAFTFVTGRTGNGLRASYNGSYGMVTRAFANSTTLIVGFSFKTSIIPGNPWTMCSFLDGGVAQVSLVMDATSGALKIYRGTKSGTLLATSSANLAAVTSYYIELKVTFNGSTGSYTLKETHGGATTTLATGSSANTAPSGNNRANQFSIGETGGAGTAAMTWDFDDMYCCDGTGSIANDFLGDVTVGHYLPNGAGHYVRVRSRPG